MAGGARGLTKPGLAWSHALECSCSSKGRASHAARGAARLAQKGRAQKQKRPLAPGCCALAAAAPGEGALQKRRLACCALAATVRYSRGTAARRRALQPGRRSTAQLQHGAVRCSQGVTARHRALQPGREAQHSTAPCATAGAPQHGAVRYSRGGALTAATWLTTAAVAVAMRAGGRGGHFGTSQGGLTGVRGSAKQGI
jgi:hypothetical protein